MSRQPGNLICCIIVTFVTHSQGILFSLDTTPDNVYCGRLQCWADKFFTDTNILSVSGLAISDVTKSSTPVKLASLSVYDPMVEQTDFNLTVTGNISWNHAELTIELRDPSYCLNGSFLCQLDFVHFGGLPGFVKETVSPGTSGNCPAVFNQFSQLAIEVKTHADEFETENAELRQQNTELRQKNTQLDKATQAQVTCVKGMFYNSSREVFLLWGKMAALCDRETDGGGWIVIQRRTSGDVNFYRGWNDYKLGFGKPETDFWIGNDFIHNLTSQGYTELRVDMEYNGTQYFAHYSQFTVTDESSNYRLSVSGYSGTAPDSLTSWHDGMEFSTYDSDHDTWSDNCASRYRGAWWYKACYDSNLNGLWAAQNDTGAAWTSVTDLKSVSFSEMKIRHV